MATPRPVYLSAIPRDTPVNATLGPGARATIRYMILHGFYPVPEMLDLLSPYLNPNKTEEENLAIVDSLRCLLYRCGAILGADSSGPDGKVELRWAEHTRTWLDLEWNGNVREPLSPEFRNLFAELQQQELSMSEYWELHRYMEYLKHRGLSANARDQDIIDESRDRIQAAEARIRFRNANANHSSLSSTGQSPGRLLMSSPVDGNQLAHPHGSLLRSRNASNGISPHINTSQQHLASSVAISGIMSRISGVRVAKRMMLTYPAPSALFSGNINHPSEVRLAKRLMLTFTYGSNGNVNIANNRGSTFEGRITTNECRTEGSGSKKRKRVGGSMELGRGPDDNGMMEGMGGNGGPVKKRATSL